MTRTFEASNVRVTVGTEATRHRSLVRRTSSCVYILWRDRGCAVGVHDRQDCGIGRHIAVGSRNGRPVGRSQYIAQNTPNRVASTVTNVV
jgi:hypothetical protein